MWTRGVTHHLAMKRFLSLFQQGPADTPHQKDGPPKVGEDCSQRAAPSHTHGRLSKYGESLFRKKVHDQLAAWRKLPMRSGLWPESSYSPNLLTLKQRKRISGTEPAVQSGRLLSERPEQRNRATEAVSQASLMQSFNQECRPSETPAVLEFQHSLQKVLKEKKKKKSAQTPV